MGFSINFKRIMITRGIILFATTSLLSSSILLITQGGQNTSLAAAAILIAFGCVALYFIRPALSIGFLICFLPLYTFILMIVYNVTSLSPEVIRVFSSWKEIFITILLVLYLTKKKRRKSPLNFVDKCAFIYLSVNIAYAFLDPFLFKNQISQILLGLKDNIGFIVMYFLGRLLYEKSNVYTILRLMLFMGVIVAGFGIIERTLLSTEFWYHINPIAYYVNVSQLPFVSMDKLMGNMWQFIGDQKVRRLSSFFGNGLGAAYFICTPMVISVFMIFRGHHNKSVFVINIILITAFILALSRGIILTVGFGFLIFLAFHSQSSGKRGFLRALAFAMIVMLLMRLSTYFHLLGLLPEIRIDTDIKAFSVGKQSVASHLISIPWIIANTFSNPIGLGLGHIEVEGFIPDLILQTGLLGLFSFLSIFIFLIRMIYCIIRKNLLKTYDYGHSLLVKALCVLAPAYLLSSVISREIVHLSVTGYFWLLAGMCSSFYSELAFQAHHSEFLKKTFRNRQPADVQTQITMPKE